MLQNNFKATKFRQKMAALQGIRVSPAKQSLVSPQRSGTTGQMDRQTNTRKSYTGYTKRLAISIKLLGICFEIFTFSSKVDFLTVLHLLFSVPFDECDFFFLLLLRDFFFPSFTFVSVLK